MKEKNGEVLKVLGATLLGFAQACINLNIVAGSKAPFSLQKSMVAW